jgi:hypothetical protein
MKQRVYLTQQQKVDIANAYTEQLTPMIQLGLQYGISRQGVYKILHQMGVDTHKGLIPVSCTACGKEIQRCKAHVRKRLHLFCDQKCYFTFLQASGYKESRWGSMVARDIVNKLFALQDQHRVHHEDRNQYNNRIDNLRVFANQGDHVRYHRGFDVTPIWNGALLSP